MERLIVALIEGERDQAIEETRKLIDAGFKEEQIISDGVEKAMEQLDTKCTVESFNLLEIMLCGRAVMGVMNELYPSEGLYPPQTKGTVVIAALEGDVHDLGKNILKTVLAASGYRVVDQGKDCSLKQLIDSAQKEGAIAIGISGLVTTVVTQVRQAKKQLDKKGLGYINVLAGGAVLKQASAADLGVDYVAQTAFDGLHYLAQKSGENNE